MKLNRQTTSPRHIRHGFSLIELLVVIVIIGILMALILPALAAVRRRAAVAEQAAEFSKLDTAITQFTSDMGVEPSSELVVSEDASVASWDSTPELILSRTRLRRIWPTFNFGGQIDFNADGNFTGDASGGGTITLSGSECLVFFLGGTLNRDTDGDGVVSASEATGAPTHIGFSKNPINPCSMTGANRQTPWFTFDPDRLVDDDQDGMPGYYPTLGNRNVPIHFASSNNGQGYYGGAAIYVQADGRTPWNANGHQLIAAGFDDGLGFVPYATPLAPRLVYVKTDSLNGRQMELDNVTNFKAGSTLGD